jgi:sugar lactone lactonase YvrE
LPASHTFAVEIDNGTSVLAEGMKAYAIVYGNNGTLATETLSGVVASGALSGETCANASCSGTLTLADAAASTIVNTSSPLALGFDNGPFSYTSTATAVGTLTPNSFAQPSAAGTAPYTVTCIASAGTFSSALSTTNTAGSGAITLAELSSLGLTYPPGIAYLANPYTCGTGSVISDGRIYVGQNATPGSVRVYAAGASGAAAPVATIAGGSTGINYPVGVTLDTSGRLYVANFSANTVTVYAANPVGTITSAPVATIGGGSTGLNNPYSVEIDANGRIFVANFSGNNVLVFAANPVGNVTAAPVATIGGGSTTISTPVRVTFDASGHVYVENYAASAGSITEFAANPIGSVTTAPLATIGGGSTGISAPVGIALDASGRIYIANNGTSMVTVYAANPVGNVTTPPVATIGGGSTGIFNPLGMTLDGSGRVYVANYGSDSILMFAANPVGNVTTTPLSTITGVTSVFGIAVR